MRTPDCICCHVPMKAEPWPILLRKAKRVIRYACFVCDYKHSVFTGFGFVDFFPSYLTAGYIYRQEESARGQVMITSKERFSTPIDNMD